MTKLFAPKFFCLSSLRSLCKTSCLLVSIRGFSPFVKYAEMLLNGPKRNRPLVFDEDTIPRHNRVGVRRRLRHFYPRQFVVSLVARLKGDQFGSRRQGQQDGAGIN